MKRFFAQLSQTTYVRNAIHDAADLAAFRQRPNTREIVGLATLAFSYVIGWPMVAALGALSMYWADPAWVAVGGPLTYGLSHLVFLLGMYLAGARYCTIFLRWLTRVAMLKLMHMTGTPLPPCPEDPEASIPNQKPA